MGRRARRRQRSGAVANQQPDKPGIGKIEAAKKDTGKQQRPPAPWGSVPLTEIAVFIALVSGVIGLVIWGLAGQAMIAAAAVLGMLAGLELALREHFAGYRSHSTLLAGLPSIIVFTLLTVAYPSREAPAVALKVAVSLSLFGAAFYLLRERFKSRAGRGWR